MKQLSFAHEYPYPDKPDGITVPTQLSYGGETITVNAKVDTGARYCLFRREHAEEIGVPVERGIPILLDTLGGPLEAFGHEVIIETCGLVTEGLVCFAKYPRLRRNLLGREGWLRKLRLAVIDYDNMLYLGDYNS